MRLFHVNVIMERGPTENRFMVYGMPVMARSPEDAERIAHVAFDLEDPDHPRPWKAVCDFVYPGPVGDDVVHKVTIGNIDRWLNGRITPSEWRIDYADLRPNE